jgi:glyoxylase-like metal-dependent hydrolase (beta-lactamase superfamily II)
MIRSLHARSLAALGLALSLAGAASAQPAADAKALPFALKQIGPGVYAAIDGPEGKSGSNAGFVIGDDGVLVVDSFWDPNATKALVAEIHKLTPKPIRWVVNTHYHLDHTGGDAVLREAGAEIIAHRNVRTWIHSGNVHLLGGDKITPPFKAQVDALVSPDLVTNKDLSVWLGSRRIDIRTVEGHTGGDLVISIPDAKVLFCGDMLWRRTPPNIIDGTVPKWIASVKGFERLTDAASMTFVPGHGDVANLQDVKDFDAYLSDLTAIVKAKRAKGLKGEDLVKAAMPEMKAKWGTWPYFDRSAPREIRYMEAELAGTKVKPVPAGD